MKTIDVRGVELAFVERGGGDETVVLSHSYLVDHRQFEAQIEALSARYRVIAYDHREHGRSARTPEAYGVDDLVTDADGLIRATGAAPCHFVGLSTGGFVGLRLALRAPDLLRSLVLMATSAEVEPVRRRLKYGAMFQLLRGLGYGPLMGSVMGLMFAPETLRAPERREEMDLWRERMRANDRQAIIRFGRAIFRRDSVVEELAGIGVPTMVVVGERDRAQPPARARVMARAIPGARLEIVPGAGHLSSVDRPRAIGELLLDFLASQERGRSGGSLAPPIGGALE